MSTMELTDAEAFGSSQTVFQALKGAALAMLVVWTVIANSLVFIVLYKNPRLQTVPNLLASLFTQTRLPAHHTNRSFRLEISHSATCALV